MHNHGKPGVRVHTHTHTHTHTEASVHMGSVYSWHSKNYQTTGPLRVRPKSIQSLKRQHANHGLQAADVQ